MSKAPEDIYIRSLFEEASLLAAELAEMDSKIRGDILSNKDILISLLGDEISGELKSRAKKAIEAILVKLGVVSKLASKTGATVFVDVLIPMEQGSSEESKRHIYFMDKPLLADKYDKKVKRLQAIYAELEQRRPPSKVSLSNQVDLICQKQACFISGKP